MVGNTRKWMRFALIPFLCCAVFMAISSPVAAQAARTGKVTVRISGIRNATGNLMVALRSDANTVVDHRTIEIDAKTLSAQTVFDNLAEGTYGVAVIHDENKNGQLDFDPSGMPLEGYGHSNNPAKRPGPPDFDETKFSLTSAGSTVNITLIYWQ